MGWLPEGVWRLKESQGLPIIIIIIIVIVIIIIVFVFIIIIHTLAIVMFTIIYCNYPLKNISPSSFIMDRHIRHHHYLDCHQAGMW